MSKDPMAELLTRADLRDFAVGINMALHDLYALLISEGHLTREAATRMLDTRFAEGVQARAAPLSLMPLDLLRQSLRASAPAGADLASKPPVGEAD